MLANSILVYGALKLAAFTQRELRLLQLLHQLLQNLASTESEVLVEEHVNKVYTLFVIIVGIPTNFTSYIACKKI